MKQWIGLSALLLALSACNLQADAEERKSVSDATAEVRQNDVSAHLPTAAESEKVSIEYTPVAEKQVFYFNSASQSVSEPAAGGYYRELLGHTADGRAVIQDFYQDVGKPQTQPAILVKGADLADFSTDTMDSKGVWYRPDGSLFQVQEFSGGKDTGPAWFFENRLVSAKLEDDTVTYYYPDATVLAVQTLMKAESAAEMRLFRENGSPLLYLRIENGANQFNKAEAWDKNGQATDPKNITEEARPLLAELSRREAALMQDTGFVMGEAVSAAGKQ